MKKIHILLFLLVVSFTTYGQIIPPNISWTPMTARGYNYKYIKSDSGLYIFAPSFTVHPPNNDSSNQIVTTAWVRRNIKGGGGVDSLAFHNIQQLSDTSFSITRPNGTSETIYFHGSGSGGGGGGGGITTETDPIFTASPSHGILMSDINNWNTAFGWGPHTGLYVPLSRTITINGVTQSFTTNPTFTVSGGSAQVNSDWNATSGVEQILNKPNLATKVNVSDTTAMLTPYLLSNIASATYQPIGNYATTTQLNAKVNISDTAAMLANYKHWAQGYLKAADILGKLNISDTSAMLAAYKTAINSLIADSIYQAAQIAAKQNIISGTGYAKFSGPSYTFNTLIPNADLVNSTISGVSLGGNLNPLSNGWGLKTLSYNGSTATSAIVDSSQVATTYKVKTDSTLIYDYAKGANRSYIQINDSTYGVVDGYGNVDTIYFHVGSGTPIIETDPLSFHLGDTAAKTWDWTTHITGKPQLGGNQNLQQTLLYGHTAYNSIQLNDSTNGKTNLINIAPNGMYGSNPAAIMDLIYNDDNGFSHTIEQVSTANQASVSATGIEGAAILGVDRTLLTPWVNLRKDDIGDFILKLNTVNGNASTVPYSIKLKTPNVDITDKILPISVAGVYADNTGNVPLTFGTVSNLTATNGTGQTWNINNSSTTPNISLSLTKDAVGLSNVDNTSDLNKPISTATQTALDAKQATLVSGTNIKTVGGNSLLGSGDIPVISVETQGLSLAPASATSQLINITGGTGANLNSATTTTAGLLNATDKTKLDNISFNINNDGVVSVEDQDIQTSLANNTIAYWSPPGNGTTVPGIVGLTAPTVVGTATARNVATTNIATRQKRLGYVSAATAGALTEARVAAAQYTCGSGTAGDGSGFRYVTRFVPSNAATVSGERFFIGLSSSTAAATNVDPSTLTNVIGIAQLSTDNTQFYLVYGGSTAQADVPCGTSLGAPNTLSTALYELTIYCPSAAANTYYVTFKNVGTGATFTQILGGAATVVPQSTTLLTHKAWKTNNATAAAVAFDICSIYFKN